MSEETLNRLVREAQQRLALFVFRSAGQHLRAMRNNWSRYDNA